METTADPGLPEVVMDVAQLIVWGAGLIGGLLAVFKAIDEIGRNREQRDRQLEEDKEARAQRDRQLQEAREARAQRDRDLRWRQAEAGKKLLDEMTDDPLSRAAMYMLDWSGRKFEIAPGVTDAITRKEVLTALSPKRPYTVKEQYIRDSFDAFFSSLVYIEKAIENGLTSKSDVEFPIGYYVDKLAEHPRVYQDFLTAYKYTWVLALLAEFEAWKNVASSSAPAPSSGEAVVDAHVRPEETPSA